MAGSVSGLPKLVDEALVVSVKLSLGQRKHVDHVRPPGKRLRGLRQHGLLSQASPGRISCPPAEANSARP
jgi:hypothetical protein